MSLLSSSSYVLNQLARYLDQRDLLPVETLGPLAALGTLQPEALVFLQAVLRSLGLGI